MKNKRSTPPSKIITFVKDGNKKIEKDKNTIVGGDATRGKANHIGLSRKYKSFLCVMQRKNMDMFIVNLLVFLMNMWNGLFSIQRP
jgi:hypothetical protein